MSSLRDQIAASAPTESTGGRSCHPGTCLTGCGSGAVGWRWYAAFGWVPVCACAIGGVVPAHLRRYDADLPAAAKPALDAQNAEIKRLRAEVAGAEEDAAEQHQNALHWQERAEQTDELLAAIVLYIHWRYVTKQLTTPQKDLFADALERDAMRVHGPDGDEPDPEMARLPSYAPRWLRDDAPDHSDGGQ